MKDKELDPLEVMIAQQEQSVEQIVAELRGRMDDIQLISQGNINKTKQGILIADLARYVLKLKDIEHLGSSFEKQVGAQEDKNNDLQVSKTVEERLADINAVRLKALNNFGADGGVLLYLSTGNIAESDYPIIVRLAKFFLADFKKRRMEADLNPSIEE